MGSVWLSCPGKQVFDENVLSRSTREQLKPPRPLPMKGYPNHCRPCCWEEERHPPSGDPTTPPTAVFCSTSPRCSRSRHTRVLEDMRWGRGQWGHRHIVLHRRRRPGRHLVGNWPQGAGLVLAQSTPVPSHQGLRDSLPPRPTPDDPWSPSGAKVVSVLGSLDTPLRPRRLPVFLLTHPRSPPHT